MDEETNVIVEETFFSYLTQLEVLRAIRYQNYVTVLLMEPDQELEDRVELKNMAKIFKEEIRTTDVIGRINHVRFGVILLHADQNHAFIPSERIRNRIKEHFLVNNHGITISIGGACFPNNSTDDKTLVSLAEKMLAQAKAKGGNIIFFPTNEAVL